MTIEIKQNAAEVFAAVSGRLDTTTAPQLENEIGEAADKANKLVLDLAGLEYISSAGLRVLLKLQKKMTPKDGLVVKNVNEVVQEVFEITGFADILTIE